MGDRLLYLAFSCSTENFKKMDGSVDGWVNGFNVFGWLDRRMNKIVDTI